MKRWLGHLLLLFLCQSLGADTLVVGTAEALDAGLLESLGEHVVVTCQDRYYQNLFHLLHNERAQTNFDDPRSLDLDICLLRCIERDPKERDHSFDDIRRQYFDTVRPLFFKSIAPSKILANMITSAHRESEVVLNFIASKLSHKVSTPLIFLMH